MAEKRKGIVARWLDGKEREEDYPRTVLPESRWRLFWNIFKGKFGKLVLTNLLMLLFCLPLAAIIIYRSISIGAQELSGPWGSGLGVGYPVIPDVAGAFERIVYRSDLFFFGLMIPACVIAGVGLSGGLYVIRNMLQTDLFLLKKFFRGVKRAFWSVLEAVLIFSVVLFAARCVGNYADLCVATGSPNAGWLIASKVIGYLFVALCSLFCLWMIALGPAYRHNPWTLLRNSVVMTFGTFPQTVLFAALATWPVFVVLFVTGFFSLIFVVLIVLFGISYFCLVWLDFTQWAFDKFIDPDPVIAAQKSAEEGKAPAPAVNVTPEIVNLDIAYGKSDLIARPIRPLDDGAALRMLPETYSRADLEKLRESKAAMQREIDEYYEAHKNEDRYVEYNKQFEEREKALEDVRHKGKKKSARPPKLLANGKRK